uniref:Epsin-2 n=1 Tax=Ascaris suum TaxID=6253 RepID=F1L0U3_ASCSU
MSISTIRRQVKNVAYNFSDTQVKVREATSNDPWGPSTALMSEIADLTHNPMSFTEIMSMLWKRLNDHGKNWRHVYKSLVLLDYLIKCGSEKVAQQCRENIYSIETLKDFQHVEENRDQGMNVREKAKQMVSLLYDEERLKNERTKFLMTRKKFMTGSAISSDGAIKQMRKSDTGPVFESELEDARPSSAGEEEMQLQIALALSREENEKEEELRKKDDIGLQMAINESRREIERMCSLDSAPQHTVSGATLSQSAIDDLLSLGVGQPVDQAPNPWGGPAADPWAPSPSTVATATTASSVYPSLAVSQPTSDPWAPSGGMTTSAVASATVDPWAPAPSLEPARVLQPTAGNGLSAVAAVQHVSSSQEDANAKQRMSTKTPESFLGENSALVNLDNLMGTTSSTTKAANNPFLSGSTALPTNPFAAQQRPSPTLNEMINNRAVQSHPGSVVLGAQPSTGMQPMMGMASVMGGIQPVGLQPQPTASANALASAAARSSSPASSQQLTNPFLL